MIPRPFQKAQTKHAAVGKGPAHTPMRYQECLTPSDRRSLHSRRLQPRSSKIHQKPEARFFWCAGARMPALQRTNMRLNAIRTASAQGLCFRWPDTAHSPRAQRRGIRFWNTELELQEGNKARWGRSSQTKWQWPTAGEAVGHSNLQDGSCARRCNAPRRQRPEHPGIRLPYRSS